MAAMAATAVLAAGCVASHSRATPVVNVPTIAGGGVNPTIEIHPPGALPTIGQAPPTGDNLVTLEGQARSVETTAGVGPLDSVRLTGAPTLSISADVVDGGGVDHGTGGLTASGADVTVKGTGMRLHGRVVVKPGSVTVDGASVEFATQVTIAAAHLTFQPPTPTPPASTSPTNAPTTTVPPPPPVTLAGPLTVRVTGASSAGVAGAGLRLADPPADLTASAGEADFSWAGSGSLTTASGPLTAGYLGVRAQQLNVTLHRGSGRVDVHGTGLALQAFTDGAPRLRTPARFDVLGNHATAGFLGRRRAFVWTPRNLGSTYDLAILRIRPGNAAAGQIHLGLLPMPPMFGGEPHALVGGDTSGLKSGDRIDSLIARNGDDKRSVGFDPVSTSTLILIVEGNFDPITVTVQL